MIFDDFCLKLYFWPFLSYLATLKGFCPLYPPGYFPIITLPPGTILTPSTIPTFQPTPPTLPPTFTPPTLPPTITPTLTPPTLPPTLPPTTLPPCPLMPLVCLAGGQRPIPYCPCIDPRQNGMLMAQASQVVAADMMIFTSLDGNTGRRKRRKRRILQTSQNCVDSRKRAGRCITLSGCPNLIEEFYDEARTMPYGMDFQTFVSELICGFDGVNFLICCVNRRPSRSQITVRPFTIATTYRPPTNNQAANGMFQFASLGVLNGGSSTNNSPPPVVQYPNSPNTQLTVAPPVVFQPTMSYPQTIPATNPSIFQPVPNTPTNRPNIQLPNQSTTPITGCGISRGTTNRVVGGVEARRGTYPWVAALGYRDEFDPNALKFLCGGSLISSTYVITSAHCINPTLALVRLGAHDLTNPAEANAMDFRVKRTIVNENFDLKSIANDIALIELSTPAPNTNFIGPICLPESSNFLTQDFVGMNPFIAGWGSIKYQGATSNVLRDAQVPIVNRQICEQSYKTVFNFINFSDRLICAGNSNVDACQGDSGGPLMMPQMDTIGVYKYYLLGIVSYGYECARPGFPGVYTRVASYIPWIKSRTN
ncbi:serine protease filzig [Teleopsis dalmanni]|uniref:serine protease filzig n=1 Tax=Teleopsis dalmanni TaxID=139649 RepID=UPI0018CFE2FC|nr:serine protease filzig [Teleopsis dalmanni]